jgi:hypothetical protein
LVVVVEGLGCWTSKTHAKRTDVMVERVLHVVIACVPQASCERVATLETQIEQMQSEATSAGTSTEEKVHAATAAAAGAESRAVKAETALADLRVKCSDSSNAAAAAEAARSDAVEMLATVEASFAVGDVLVLPPTTTTKTIDKNNKRDRQTNKQIDTI